MYSCSSYISSPKNPSDDPTRGKKIRPPDIILPDWWLEAVEGNFSKMDEYLADCGVHPDQLCGYGNLGDLCHPSAELVDPQPRSKFQQHKKKVQAKLVDRAIRKAVTAVVPGDLRRKTFDVDIGPGDLHRKTFGVDNEEHFALPRTTPWSKEADSVLCSFPRELFILGKGVQWPPSVPGFIDLYSGQKGFAKAASRLGAPWVLTIDINDGPHCDLLNSDLRDRIAMLLSNGVAMHFSAAPICSSFSRAVTPAVRSKAEPLGVKGMSAIMRLKVSEGNSHGSFLARLLLICLERSITLLG